MGQDMFILVTYNRKLQSFPNQTLNSKCLFWLNISALCHLFNTPSITDWILEYTCTSLQQIKPLGAKCLVTL